VTANGANFGPRSSGRYFGSNGGIGGGVGGASNSCTLSSNIVFAEHGVVAQATTGTSWIEVVERSSSTNHWGFVQRLRCSFWRRYVERMRVHVFQYRFWMIFLRQCFASERPIVV
jgi:hypothetical protein